MAETKSLAVAVAVLMFMAMLSKGVEGRVFVVGDRFGWKFLNYKKWCTVNKFRAGDVLIFKYDATVHNVAVVDAKAYRTCFKGPQSKVFNGGNNRFVLRKGMNYFLCARPGHCDAGMKLAIFAR